MKAVSVDIDGVPLPLLVSQVIPAPFRHGFTTRAGGVSAPPYDTFNLGRAWGDGREQVLENRRRLVRWLGTADGAGRRVRPSPDPSLCLVTQVHGRAVARVRDGLAAAALAEVKADGLCTDVAGAALGVFVADCVPLVLADPRTGACAAVHAGWRGVVAGVAGAAVAEMAAAYGSRPEDLRVAMGPAIGVCCFEVGEEVASAFAGLRPGGGAGVIDPRSGAKPHIDLRRALTLELLGLGIPGGQIEAATFCTRCDPAGRFYSYRRDNTRTGQHLAVITRVG